MANASKRPTARADHIIAATYSTDADSVREGRYQPTQTTRAIYTFGNDYFACGRTPPKDDVGQPWEKHRDQFFAERAGTVLWVSRVQA